jgi:hypothetical protein
VIEFPHRGTIMNSHSAKLVAFVFLLSPALAPAGTFEVYPPKVELHGSRDEQRLGVSVLVGSRLRDSTIEATYRSRNPNIAVVSSAGLVRPVADGQATIEIGLNGSAISIPVIVRGMHVDSPVNFSREVQPVLTKAGCNQGACHGAQYGRGGFKLSLFGFDPLFDYAQIVQSNEGRRVVVSDPERSILLQKPALVMEHGGGERLKVGSRGYETIKRWLEDGAPEPAGEELKVTQIEAWPARQVMAPGEKRQLLVTATWSDGRREDVTEKSLFDTLNDAVAAVAPTGVVTAKAKGETFVMIRFGGQASVVQVTLPFATLPSYPDVPRHNFVDEKLVAKWRELGLTPSPLANDAEFFRRIHLDAVGTLPDLGELRRFLVDKSPDKRMKAIDQVLSRPEFVDYWAYKWGDLLRINRDALEEKGMWSFHNWVRASLRDNKPVDEFVRDIVTAEGSTYTDGPANFYRIGATAEDWSETVTQVFLGIRVQCAKCHHHPFEKWSQDDYYGMSAFFVRLGKKNSQEFGIFGRETVVYIRSVGEQTHPRKRAVVKPHPLDGDAVDDPIDRRRKLAEWLTSPSNTMFSKNIVNRFWGYLMGRGLVDPLDDMRATNPPSNPELLDSLAKDFAIHKFDLKHLLRTIMQSRAYQLSSMPTDGNAADAANTFFTRYTVKRLTSEQVADAIDNATGTREKYLGLPLGTRAIQLPDPRVRSYLMDVFGRPSRQITCECERTTRPNVAQALHLLNGEFLNRKIADPQGRVQKLLAAKMPQEKLIEELYTVTVSRFPTDEEIERAKRWISAAPNPREGVHDLLWVLLNSREFLFNH